jgi:hypothetical protein
MEVLVAKKKPAAAAVADVDVAKLLSIAERLADDVLKTNADIGDVRKRLGDVERRLDELRILPLTVLELKDRLSRPARPWWARLLGR